MIVKLISEGKVVFYITLDENGMELGKEMEGKLVEVIGGIFTENEDYWLKVDSYGKGEKDFKEFIYQSESP